MISAAMNIIFSCQKQVVKGENFYFLELHTPFHKFIAMALVA